VVNCPHHHHATGYAVRPSAPLTAICAYVILYRPPKRPSRHYYRTLKDTQQTCRHLASAFVNALGDTCDRASSPADATGPTAGKAPSEQAATREAESLAAVYLPCRDFLPVAAAAERVLAAHRGSVAQIFMGTGSQSCKSGRNSSCVWKGNSGAYRDCMGRSTQSCYAAVSAICYGKLWLPAELHSSRRQRCTTSREKYNVQLLEGAARHSREHNNFSLASTMASGPAAQSVPAEDNDSSEIGDDCEFDGAEAAGQEGGDFAEPELEFDESGLELTENEALETFEDYDAIPVEDQLYFMANNPEDDPSDENLGAGRITPEGYIDEDFEDTLGSPATEVNTQDLVDTEFKEISRLGII
uniref:Link domain-containing protein n=1 Tax=Macrostomum lignano TaxID=282301 RepID=A0A1I8IYB7_9PLAT